MPFDALPPIGLREVDWSNPLTRGLKALYILDQAGYVHNLADRRNHGRWTDAATMGLRAEENGRLATEFTGNATTARIDLGDVGGANPISLYGLPKWTVAAKATMDSLAGANSRYPRLVDKSDAGSASSGWAIYFDNKPNKVFFRVGGSGTGGTNLLEHNSSNFPDGVVNTIAYVSRNTTATINPANVDTYFNGVAVSPTASATQTIVSDTAPMAIGNLNHSADREWNGSIEWVALWARDLTDAEVKAIDADIYQILRPEQPLFKAAATGGDTNVNASAAALTLTALQADVSLDVNVEAATEALTLTALQADVSLGVNIEASPASLTIAGLAADVSLDVNVNASAAALTLTQLPADVSLDVNISAGFQSLALTAYPATIAVDGDVVVNAGFQTLTLTAYPATIEATGTAATYPLRSGTQNLSAPTGSGTQTSTAPVTYGTGGTAPTRSGT